MSFNEGINYFKRTSAVTVVLFVIVAVLLVPSVLAASISRGYNTSDNELVVGMATSLSEDSTPDNPLVERASTSNKDKFVGITTTREASSVTVTNKTSEVIVTTQGNVKTLVSNINGEVKKGDLLTPSPIKGFLMKTDGGDPLIVGVALEDFVLETSNTEKVHREDGSEAEVKIGAISADVLPPKNQVSPEDDRSSLVTFVKNFTGKDVARWKIFASALIFFALLVTEGAIIYSAVHSTIGALGRNPLARNAIYKQLLQVVIIALAILTFGGVILYTLLWT